LPELRAPNRIKHACVNAKISNDAKNGAALIANKVKPIDKVSADFRINPSGWHDFLLRAASTRFAHIRDMRCSALLALSKNRDSASRVSFC